MKDKPNPVEKYKLDLIEINEISQPSTARGLIRVFYQFLQSAGGWLATGGLLVSLLALAGVTVIFAVHILIAAIAVAVLGGLAIGMTVYKIGKDREKMAAKKAALDTDLTTLRSSVTQIFSHIGELTKLYDELHAEVVFLEGLANSESDPRRKSTITTQVDELKLRRLRVYQAKNEMASKLLTTLNVITEPNRYREYQLAHLFGLQTRNAQVDESTLRDQILEHLPEGQNHAHVKSGFNSFLEMTTNQSAHRDDDQQQKEDLYSSMKYEKERVHGTIKRLTYGLTAIGGFLAGAGSTLAVASLVLGGTAALIAVGWPILLGALAVGVVVASAAIIYTRHVENKQSKIMNRMNAAAAQVSGMKAYLEKTFEKVSKQTSSIQESYKNSHKAINTQLDTCQKSLELLEACVIQHQHPHPEKDNTKERKQLLKENLGALKLLQRQIEAIVADKNSAKLKSDLSSKAAVLIKANEAALEPSQTTKSLTYHSAGIFTPGHDKPENGKKEPEKDTGTEPHKEIH